MKRLTQTVVASTVLCTLLLFVAAPADATYPGKNGLIAISSDRGHGEEIYTIRSDGSDITRITNIDDRAKDPDWSPDGTKIVFNLVPAGEEDQCRIFMMNADGSDLVELTPKRFAKKACTRGAAYDPSFTPNGRRIVFLGQRCGRCTLAIRSMNLRGGDLRRIAPLRVNDSMHAPRVSPDGKTIAFVAVDHRIVNGEEGNRKALYTIGMNGTHLKQIVPYSYDVCACGGIGLRTAIGSSRATRSDRPRFLVHRRTFSPCVPMGPVCGISPTITRRARTCLSPLGRTRRTAAGSSSSTPITPRIGT
jgi:hypothetical protein